MDFTLLSQINEAYRHGVYAEETLSEEELVSIEEWVEALIEEGYDLDQYSDEELYTAYLEEAKGEGPEHAKPGTKTYQSVFRGYKPKSPSEKEAMHRGSGSKAKRRADNMEESVDIYDIVSEYLVSEGFCDSHEDADVIMANMSEEWRDEILEKADNTIRLVYGKGGKGVPIKGGSGNVLRTPNVGFAQQGRDFKMATAQADETASQNAGRRGKTNRRNAALYNRALKKGIENATNRSDKEPEEGHDYSNEPESFTNRNARRRRASGR
jgi:hypothetical protein